MDPVNTSKGEGGGRIRGQTPPNAPHRSADPPWSVRRSVRHHAPRASGGEGARPRQGARCAGAWTGSTERHNRPLSRPPRPLRCFIRGPPSQAAMPTPAAGDPGGPTTDEDDAGVPVHQLFPLRPSKIEPLIREKICSLDYVSKVGYIDEGREEVTILVIHDYDPDRLGEMIRGIGDGGRAIGREIRDRMFSPLAIHDGPDLPEGIMADSKIIYEREAKQ